MSDESNLSGALNVLLNHEDSPMLRKKHYCLGFAFHPDNPDVVALISKTHPEEQAGLLNGVGGKLELDESAEEAMIREWREETGQNSSPDWKKFATVDDEKFTIHCFRGVAKERDFDFRIEQVYWIQTGELHDCVRLCHGLVSIAREVGERETRILT